jgi:hypothetical protein
VDPRNHIGLYGSWFPGMAGIGFTLPFLPLYLGQENDNWAEGGRE